MFRKYESNFKEFIIGLIQEKRATGYEYGTQQYVLERFDRFCITRHADETELTAIIAMDWATMLPTENAGGFMSRVAPVRELARYMLRQGYSAFVIPSGIASKPPRKVPHIFTDSEISFLFDITDNLKKPKRMHSIRHLMIPIMFRLLYTCGLRPMEPLRIKISDVDFETGRIFIAESKEHRDRNIVLSHEMLSLLRKYYDKTRYFYPGTQYLFPNHRGQQYSAIWFEKVFQICWGRSQNAVLNRARPRLYDFRHTFATKCFYKWSLEGKDLNAWLPYLSAYMGHVQYTDTAYYIHLVPSFTPGKNKLSSDKFKAILPEVLR